MCARLRQSSNYLREKSRLWCDCPMKIVRPEAVHLESYRSALIRAISSGTAANLEEAQDDLSEIEADPGSFLAKQENPKALGGDVKLPDGSFVPRLPGITRWMWDGQVCGDAFC